MFLLDSLMIAGIRWTLETVITAAEAELNDDSVLREQLLDAEMRRELGEIDAAEFARVEADLLSRIREIKDRRSGGPAPLAFGGSGQGDGEGAPGRIQVDASVEGDWTAGAPPPAAAPAPARPRRARRGRKQSA